MKLHRLIRRFYMAPFGEEGGGGGVDAAPIDSAPAPDAPQASEAPAAPTAPATMLDAITQGLEPQSGQPRDELGRWAPKLDAAGAVIPGQVQPPNTTLVAPEKPAVPAVETDPLAMPEGLGAKAQERFQRLANNVREITVERDEARSQSEYIRNTFQTHGVTQPQFEQAVGVIALVNKGDWDGAQRILEQQLQQIALKTGRPIGQIDALAGFPDLREAVDGLQIPEQHALEIARARSERHQQQQGQQRAQQAQQTQQQEQQAFDAGVQAVDVLCRQMASSDMDWPVIEAQLLPVMKDVLDGVPPRLWDQKIRAQVQIIKATAQRFKPAATTGSNALRPTGQASPQQAPKSMAEAMWGKTLAA